MKKLILIMLIGSLGAFAQTDLVFPWVTNTSLFGSTVVLNNLNDTDVTVEMTATRADGTNETVFHNIAPYGQMVSSAGELFPVLGEGPGYSVRVTSDDGGIKGALVVSGTGSPSGSSPAQADVLETSSGSNVVLYSYLPLSSGFSAPVVVNLGDAATSVTFYAFQDGQQVAASDAVSVEPGHPYTALASDLFPGVTGDVYVAAEGDQALVGMAFIFNDSREPSMSAASAIDAVPSPDPIDPGGGRTGSFDVDAAKGAGFAHDLIRDNFEEFNTLSTDIGSYAFLGAPTPWALLAALLPAFVDDDITNGEAINVILNYDIKEEVNTSDPGAGTPSGTGAAIGGVVQVVADPGDGTTISLFLNIPVGDGMDRYFEWFQLDQ